MLKLQYFGHLMQTAHSLKKTLMLRKTEGRGEWGDRGWASCIASPIQWNWIWTNSRRWWRTWKPGVLQSMGSQRIRYNWVTNSCLESHGWRSLVGCSPWGRWVGHDWATSLWLFTFMHWRRKWQPTPVFLPGESQGWGNLVSCHLWGCTESDTTEAT